MLPRLRKVTHRLTSSWASRHNHPETRIRRRLILDSRVANATGLIPIPLAFPVWLLLMTAFVSTAFLANPATAQTDEQIQELIEKAGGKDDYADASRVIVFDKTDVDVEESGLSHTRRHVLRKILTDGGVLGEAVQRFNYDPASNFIRIESIRIFRKGLLKKLKS